MIQMEVLNIIDKCEYLKNALNALRSTYLCKKLSLLMFIEDRFKALHWHDFESAARQDPATIFRHSWIWIVSTHFRPCFIYPAFPVRAQITARVAQVAFLGFFPGRIEHSVLGVDG